MLKQKKRHHNTPQTAQ